jgi:hypothetical protein
MSASRKEFPLRRGDRSGGTLRHVVAGAGLFGHGLAGIAGDVVDAVLIAMLIELGILRDGSDGTRTRDLRRDRPRHPKRGAGDGSSGIPLVATLGGSFGTEPSHVAGNGFGTFGARSVPALLVAEYLHELCNRPAV